MVKGGYLYGNTNGEYTQFRCTNVLYFLYLLVFEYSIKIDCGIGSPGHDKDLVDGLDAVDKYHLKYLRGQ